MRNKLNDLGYEDCIIFDDLAYDEAIVGITHDNRVVYDSELMIQALIDHDGMSYEEAIDWFEYNTLRGLDYFPYPNKPIIIMCNREALED